MNENVVVTLSPKSVGISLILTFFFGGLGLLYSNIKGGIIIIIISLICALFLPLLIIPWIASMIWGVTSVKKYNEKLFAKVKPKPTE